MLKRKPHRQARSGIAATELAIGLPVIVLLVFGALQMSRTIQLRQLGLMITDEIAREAATTSRSDDEIVAATQTLATAAGLDGVQASIVHDTTTSLVRVELSMPLRENYGGPVMVPIAADIVAATSAYRYYSN